MYIVLIYHKIIYFVSLLFAQCLIMAFLLQDLCRTYYMFLNTKIARHEQTMLHKDIQCNNIQPGCIDLMQMHIRYCLHRLHYPFSAQYFILTIEKELVSTVGIDYCVIHSFNVFTNLQGHISRQRAEFKYRSRDFNFSLIRIKTNAHINY